MHLDRVLFSARFAAEMERTVRVGGVCVVAVEDCGGDWVREVAIVSLYGLPLDGVRGCYFFSHLFSSFSLLLDKVNLFLFFDFFVDLLGHLIILREMAVNKN